MDQDSKRRIQINFNLQLLFFVIETSRLFFYTGVQVWTTIWHEGSQNIQNETFLEKYGKQVIIGSCTFFLTIVIAVCIKMKTCVHTRNKQLEDKVTQSSEYNQSIPNDGNARITLYKSLNLNESFDPELYENTRYSLSSTY